VPEEHVGHGEAEVGQAEDQQDRGEVEPADDAHAGEEHRHLGQLDDPDQHFVENYGCGALRNFNGYCNPELTALMATQSRERDTEKRRAVVRAIERKLVEDTVRPIISHTVAAACMQPEVKGLTIMSNSIYNGWRFEDVWLDR